MSTSPTTPLRMADADWLAGMRQAAAGAELMDWITRRLTRPHEEGPVLDERHGEGPEEVFERLAKADEQFRARLDETVRQYFASEASNPAHQPAIPVIRGVFEMVQRLALNGAVAPIRAWLQQHESTLRAEAGAYLARAALGALATAQTPGIADFRDFWLRWWRNGPPAWQPRAFIGLRIQDPTAAAREIPLLLQRARGQSQDPGALLHGLWNQPGGREAIIDWLREHDGTREVDEVRAALRARLEDKDLPLLNRANAPRRRSPPLRSLAPSRSREWWTH